MRLWIFLDLLLFVVEPCLIILGGIFIMLGLLKFRFGMHLFQDIFSTLWFRHRVQKGRIKVSCFTCESQLQGVYRHPSSGHSFIQLFSVWQLGLRSSTWRQVPSKLSKKIMAQFKHNMPSLRPAVALLNATGGRGFTPRAAEMWSESIIRILGTCS